MNVFLDTSSLLKLYCKEKETEELVSLIVNANLQKIYLTEIAKIEFASAIWKKVRTQELTSTQATVLLALFENDSQHFLLKRHLSF